MVGLSLLLAVASQAGVLTPFQGLFLKATAPIEGGINAIFRPFAAFLADAGSLNDLQDENRALRLENEQLRNDVSALQQDAERVRELEEALEITSNETAGTRVAASIVHRDSSAFTDVVSIDRGSSSGIKSGMVVLSSQGTLIGTVTKAFAGSAFVRLVTDSQSKVAAQVQESKVDGLVRGSPGRGLTFDLAQADIKVGDIVVTSGLGGNYPPGVPIGKVAEVSGTAQDLFRKVKLDPLVRLSTAKTVLVLTSFIPQRIDLESE
ncbi:MAG: rod shape-determining protein MreC [Tepidiformaceae bacterium]